MNPNESIELCAPLAVPGGAKLTATVHLPFAASGRPEHWSLIISNEPGSVPPSAAVPSVTGTVLEFEISIFLGVPAMPASTAANDCDFGALSVKATPSPSRATAGLVPL